MNIQPSAVFLARSGNKEAMTQLLNDIRPNMVAIIRHSGVHANDLDDVIQESLLAVVRCLRTWQHRYGPFEAYIVGAIRRTILEKFRTTKPSGVPLDQVAEPQEQESRSTIEVEDMLERLPQDQRQLVLDHFGFGNGREYSINQLSGRHGMTRAMTEAKLKEALSTLKQSV